MQVQTQIHPQSVAMAMDEVEMQASMHMEEAPPVQNQDEVPTQALPPTLHPRKSSEWFEAKPNFDGPPIASRGCTNVILLR